ncbi:hypothetical protein [Brunnivagina elsteri]|nr:hypothetical protein [Calothrix elsteri]
MRDVQTRYRNDVAFFLIFSFPLDPFPATLSSRTCLMTANGYCDRA